jgi:hypothetical protein
MDSVSESSEYEMHYFLGDDRHFRFQPALELETSSMDCTTDKNMRKLGEIATKYLAQTTGDKRFPKRKPPAEQFERVCALLADSGNIHEQD